MSKSEPKEKVVAINEKDAKELGIPDQVKSTELPSVKDKNEIENQADTIPKESGTKYLLYSHYPIFTYVGATRLIYFAVKPMISTLVQKIPSVNIVAM